ncbi:MAG: NAD(P)-dependent oxidoreductase [Actinomycetota bacterium]|nr:NAD(P)-dependent oxidoreductase [Actinomycetota bacterium]
MAEIGFVGLGTMGSAMARRLVDAGHTVRVWNRNPDAASPLLDAGAIPAESAAHALESGIVFSMLSNDAAVDAVFSEETLRGAAGTLHVNMASVSPVAARALAERHTASGVDYVAAPVLGRPPVAAAGQLNILAGGADADIERAAEFLDVLGARTWRIGTDPAQANLVKIAVNFTLIHAIEALGESIALVENHGFAPEQFVELLTNTLFGGVAYAGYGDIIAHRRYEPAGFSAVLGLKDLGLAEAAAAEVGVTLPTAPALRSVFEQTLAGPGGDKLDWAAIAEISRTVHR